MKVVRQQITVPGSQWKHQEISEWSLVLERIMIYARNPRTSLTLCVLLTSPTIQHAASWSALRSSGSPPLTFKYTHLWYLLVTSISLLPLLWESKAGQRLFQTQPWGWLPFAILWTAAAVLDWEPQEKRDCRNPGVRERKNPWKLSFLLYTHTNPSVLGSRFSAAVLEGTRLCTQASHPHVLYYHVSCGLCFAAGIAKPA